jgi:hypothetical protein
LFDAPLTICLRESATMSQFFQSGQFFVKWAATKEQQKDQKQQAQSWLEALKKGENPLTLEVLKGLR